MIGLVLNTVDTIPFRARLANAGFYSKEKTAFGDDAWSALERSVGHLG
jgi:hypothetical protein